MDSRLVTMKEVSLPDNRNSDTGLVLVVDGSRHHSPDSPELVLCHSTEMTPSRVVRHSQTVPKVVSPTGSATTKENKTGQAGSSR